MRGILGAAAVLGLVAGLVAFRPELLALESGRVRVVAAGALVGVAGSLGGFWLALRGLAAATQARFLASVFGGMALRLTLFGVALVAVLLIHQASAPAFLAGLIPVYLGFQAAEVMHLHRSAVRRQEAGPEQGPGVETELGTTDKR